MKTSQFWLQVVQAHLGNYSPQVMVFTGWKLNVVLSAWEPIGTPLYFLPIECAASSIKIKLCFLQISFISSICTAWPVKSTAITALVLFVIFSLIFSGSIFHVYGSISAKTGVPPQYRTQFAEAAKVIGVVTASYTHLKLPTTAYVYMSLVSWLLKQKLLSSSRPLTLTFEVTALLW